MFSGTSQGGFSVQVAVYLDVIDNSKDGAHVCPQCSSGTLQKRTKENADTDVVRVYWACSHDPVCRYQARDHEGLPLGRFPCSCCGRNLNLVQSKTESFWACEGWFDTSNTCRTSFENLNGAPADGTATNEHSPRPSKDDMSDAGA